jgi:hypothetical protein
MSIADSIRRGVRLNDVVEAALLGASSRKPLGTNVLSREWDLMVVLDTCRYDALRTVAPEFDFIEAVGRLQSVGSSTREWTANTFTRKYADEVAETTLVCGNKQVTSVLETGDALESSLARRTTNWDVCTASEFEAVDAVAHYAPMDPFGGISLPRIITDRSVRVARDTDPTRLIVHYLPPHNPYRAAALRENRPLEPYEYRPFRHLRNGGDLEPVWESYLAELRRVLDDVELLLNNVDANRAVITADHGELFGELGLYSHPTGVPHPALRGVPWMEPVAVAVHWTCLRGRFPVRWRPAVR